MKQTLYKIGDEVTINNISWKVKSIRRRFGMMLVYDMDRNDGIKDSLSIETGSLETLMGENNGKTG